MNIAAGTQTAGECFHNIFEFSQFYHLIRKHGENVLYFFQRTLRAIERKSLVYLRYQVANSPCCPCSIVVFPLSIQDGFQRALSCGCSLILSNFVLSWALELFFNTRTRFRNNFFRFLPAYLSVQVNFQRNRQLKHWGSLNYSFGNGTFRAAKFSKWDFGQTFKTRSKALG